MNAKELVASVKHWHQDFEVAPGVWTNGSYKPHFWLNWMNLPQRLDGLRVLEIGSCDGFFTIELARRGAHVVAVDYQPKDQTGFAVAEKLSGFSFEFHLKNIYELTVHTAGKFDIVLCLGVLYHLPDPYKALCIISDCCKIGGSLFIETVAAELPGVNEPVMRFYKGRSLVGDITNFWTQNPACLVDLTEDVGFKVVRTHVVPSGGAEWTRMSLEAQRVELVESEQRKSLAYGHWTGF